MCWCKTIDKYHVCCYVFCICLLTYKYQKYKSVELGDQLHHHHHHHHHNHHHHHHHLNEDINSRICHAATHCYVQNSAVSKIWKFTNFLKNITQICQFKIENREKSNLIDIILAHNLGT